MNITEKAGYPRPDFIRTDWQSLSGEWEFDFDDNGALEQSFAGGGELFLSRTIRVPFPYQSPASGIDDQDHHGVMWYRRSFAITSEQLSRTVLLHFGAVDHDAAVWVNGNYVGGHKGGYTPFAFEISRFLHAGENELLVRCEDTLATDQVRGKQFWERQPSGCHYVSVSGIWQEVWLEFAGETYIRQVHFVTDFDDLSVTAEVELSREFTGSLALRVSKEGSAYCEMEQSVKGKSLRITVNFPDYGYQDPKKLVWSPANPHLFDAAFSLLDENDAVIDTVDTYFGFRKISTACGHVFLNNSQVYLRMILDQGYWTEGIYRPVDDDAFRVDVELTKQLGFNCARKHQKVEDPKYYYWADRLGLMVWGELPSFYGFTANARNDAANTMREFIDRDFNHPCIIAWVPLNESWGVRHLLGDPRQADFGRMLYHMCKCEDPSRFVSTNDGWENIFPTDVVAVHDYRSINDNVKKVYEDPDVLNTGAARTGHPYLMPGENRGDKPILYTEFGGKRLAEDAGWGYDEAIASVEKYLADMENDVLAVLHIPYMDGFCYTQLYDTYQETNGLLRMDRTPKADMDRIRDIFAHARW